MTHPHTQPGSAPVAWRRIRDDGIVTYWEREVPGSVPLYATPAQPAGMRAALEPFARIAEEYSDNEDDAYEIWRDLDQAQTRITLGQCRAARVALALPAERPAVAQDGLPDSYHDVVRRIAASRERRMTELREALQRIRDFPYIGEKAAQAMALIARQVLARPSTDREDK